MNERRTVFAQLMSLVPHTVFARCVERYRGNYRARTFTCWDQFLCMAFAQLTFRESLRDSEARLRALPEKLYHMGIRGRVSRDTLAVANERRDWRIYADLAQVLIDEARQLYADQSPPWSWSRRSMRSTPPPSIRVCRSFPGPTSSPRKPPSRCTRCSTGSGSVPVGERSAVLPSDPGTAELSNSGLDVSSNRHWSTTRHFLFVRRLNTFFEPHGSTLAYLGWTRDWLRSCSRLCDDRIHALSTGGGSRGSYRSDARVPARRPRVCGRRPLSVRSEREEAPRRSASTLREHGLGKRDGGGTPQLRVLDEPAPRIRRIRRRLGCDLEVSLMIRESSASSDRNGYIQHVGSAERPVMMDQEVGRKGPGDCPVHLEQCAERRPDVLACR
jgi:hypothetical protein